MHVVSDLEFETFVRSTEPRLRRALIAAYGLERGSEAVAEALAFAWEHRERVMQMENAPGYLYRVGQSRSRPRRRAMFPDPETVYIPDVEPRLPVALSELSERQRVAVVLVGAFQWQLTEVAVLLDLSVPTVQKHYDRAMKKLRRSLRITP